MGLARSNRAKPHFAFRTWQISGATRIVCIRGSRVTIFVLQKFDQFGDRGCEKSPPAAAANLCSRHESAYILSGSRELKA
jgi:hypothetical protein